MTTLLQFTTEHAGERVSKIRQYSVILQVRIMTSSFIVKHNA